DGECEFQRVDRVQAQAGVEQRRLRIDRFRRHVLQVQAFHQQLRQLALGVGLRGHRDGPSKGIGNRLNQRRYHGLPLPPRHATRATMPAAATRLPAAPALSVDYVAAPGPEGLLAPGDVLAVFGFGDAAPAALEDPRYLRIPLQPHRGAAPYEVWRTGRPVRSGRDGDIAWASDGALSFGVIEVDERALAGGDDPTGIVAAATHAYARLTAFIQASDTPHLLRIWNYLDAITHGEGDHERYRQFCIGRARGLGDFAPERLPAATAIGRCDQARVLQVYWLAAAAPGTPLENPRQVSAYRYPREYGPQPPSFARAMLPPTADRTPLLLSGTA